MKIPFLSNWYQPIQQSYDAARGHVAVSISPEEKNLWETDRTSLIDAALQEYRNNPVCKFAVNKYIQFAARFDYYVEGNKQLSDTFYEQLQSLDNRKRTIDEILTLIEYTRLLQGDALVLTSERLITVIEGSSIETPRGKQGGFPME